MKETAGILNFFLFVKRTFIRMQFFLFVFDPILETNQYQTCQFIHGSPIKEKHCEISLSFGAKYLEDGRYCRLLCIRRKHRRQNSLMEYQTISDCYWFLTASRLEFFEYIHCNSLFGSRCFSICLLFSSTFLFPSFLE